MTEELNDSSSNGLNLHALLRAMMDYEASDLHITTGSPPQLRIDGSLTPLKTEALRPAETQRLCYSVLSEEQREKFEKEKELDFSFGLKNMARFRANFFMQRGAVGAAIRKIPFEVPSMEELGIPEAMRQLVRRSSGLVLVTGPTGSGKSTTLASIIHMLNHERRGHIITIEDPIEYLHPHKMCLINQREVGHDTQGFKEALKYVLRQDPDIILIGEMRDLETIEAALTLSETGHLVFATLHTNSSVQTINRIINVFPTYQRLHVRAQLSFVLQGVLSQQLLPKVGGGRVLATEMMVSNAAVRNLIREEKIHQIYSHIQVGGAKYGTQTMNQCLYELIRSKTVLADDALSRSPNFEELERMLRSEAS